MLPFKIENLRNVNRVVATSGAEAHLYDAEGLPVLRHSAVHVSLYIGSEQVALGAPRQKKAKNGAFTTDRSGLRLTLMYLEEISGMKFKGQPFHRGVEEYHRSDLTVVPFLHHESGLPRSH